jgi:Uma2 family endonuclease
MGMPAAPAYYTAEMVRALPDDGSRYETVHGELLVTPAPRLVHQRVLGRLYRALAEYVERCALGEAFMSPADVSWGPDILVQPDLFVVPAEEARHDRWEAVQRLPLVVEILSPSSVRADRFTKRRLYQEVGVPLYWVVDIEQQLVEVWTPAARFPAIERQQIRWHPAGAGEPFDLNLESLFRPL